MPAARRYYRRHAEAVERVADAIGANDPGLANRLYSAAAEVRAYGDQFAEHEPQRELKPGDRVSVRFTGGVVVQVTDDQVRVGCARYYGGGWFDRQDVHPAPIL